MWQSKGRYRFFTRLAVIVVLTSQPTASFSSGQARPSEELLRASKERPWTNSLGMRFVQVPNTKVLFSIWETRVKDFTPFATTNKTRNNGWRRLIPSDSCPVVEVSWQDAKGFCSWLTQKEQAEGVIPTNAYYRLPTDAEWSYAVGLGSERGGTPHMKFMNSIRRPPLYPWGKGPPSRGDGNFPDETGRRSHKEWPEPSPYDSIFTVYDDGFAETAPVGSFLPNQYGLFDLGGNAQEWCEDYHNGQNGEHVLRGGGWDERSDSFFLSSFRSHSDGEDQSSGFRVVLAKESSANSRNDFFAGLLWPITYALEVNTKVARGAPALDALTMSWEAKRPTAFNIGFVLSVLGIIYGAIFGRGGRTKPAPAQRKALARKK